MSIRAAAAAAALATMTPATAALADAADPSLLQAIEGGKLILDLRPRYEQVDQDGLFREAKAFTLRTQLGWRTESWRNLVAQVEMENVADLDGQHFNSTINGKTSYPAIPDPPTTELHVAQLQWTPDQDVTITAGRQRVDLDDQRFIGTVNWRQDEQTFDAARLDGQLGRFSLTYVYLEQINRPFAEALDWRSDSHALNLYFTAAPTLRLEGFGYLFDFRESPANSTQTYGAKASGRLPLGPLKLIYAATYARQEPYGTNPGRFGLDYWHAELTGAAGPVSVTADYEVLGGDGSHGFGTPLA
ncbi:MAG TPA: alginate export family protein, partial [Caulobacteraceae bacterium]|nr:alginate export family protein [Caulobacteraceae bacterium]